MIIQCCNYKIILDSFSIIEINKNVNFDSYSKIFLLSEKKILKLWWRQIKEYFPNNIEIIEINSGESVKNINTASEICSKMINLNADRKSLLINFGGGMISDLGGFTASIYMRGIDFINIPTTLLSIVDASIGGKNAVNLQNIKNIVGTFNNPKLVLIDTEFLNTLEERELISSVSEILKHGIIHDLEYFDSIKEGINLKNNEQLINVIKKSIEIKKYIVEKDFEEKNIRKLLNFGHTIGHAFETYSFNTKYQLLHGEAIAIGIVIESMISLKLGIFNEKELKIIKKSLNNCGFSDLFEMKFDYNVEELIKLMMKDKKNENNKIKFVLPEKIGKCIHSVPVDLKTIEYCLNKFLHEKN